MEELIEGAQTHQSLCWLLLILVEDHRYTYVVINHDSRYTLYIPEAVAVQLLECECVQSVE